jgi:murein L,D-transpeptidase YcbB/YkuD
MQNMKSGSSLTTGRLAINLQNLYWMYCLGLLLILAGGCGSGVSKREDALFVHDSGKAYAGSGHQQLTSAGVAALRVLLDSGTLPQLHWPGFQNYQPEVKKFYSAFNDTLPWLRDSEPTPQALAIIQALKGAETKGLRPEDYDGHRWDERIESLRQKGATTEPDLIRFDVALTVSAMRCISDLHIGRINPRLFHFGLDIDQKQFDLSGFLQSELVDAKDVNVVLGTVEPPFPAYHRTIDALNRYLELARRDDGDILPMPAKVVKPGDSYSGVALLAKRLQLVGDLSPQDEVSSASLIYQGNLVAAVKHFQERHGLDSNGRIDAQTFKQLNTPLSRRVIQLQLTLDRWRWLPHQFSRPPIVVNIPEFQLHADDEEYQWVFSMKVVVGKAYRHKTPVFANQIKSVIFRPYWNVPLSIQRDEIVPHIRKDPSYLAANSYEIVDRSGNVVSEGAVTDEIKDALQSGKLAVRQKPGTNNALGLVKFEFPNPYDVYMHGTPAEQLFSRSRRDFSHGCIRVEDPVALAAWVLRDKPEWTVERIRDAINGDETIRVDLKSPIPVLILYGTAVVTEEGEVQFFDDIYGYDADLERALNKDYPNTD